MPRNASEHDIQAAVFAWADVARATMPELDAMYGIINEGRRGRKQNPKTGAWYSPEGARYKRQGMKAGMPDVCLPVPRGPFGALYVEFKKPGGRAAKHQRERHSVLAAAGNLVLIVDNFDDAVYALTKYLSGDLDCFIQNT